MYIMLNHGVSSLRRELLSGLTPPASRAAPLVADREAKLQRLQKCSSWGAVYFALSSDDHRHIVRDVKGMTP
jgi:hypothetical protein